MYKVKHLSNYSSCVKLFSQSFKEQAWRLSWKFQHWERLGQLFKSRSHRSTAAAPTREETIPTSSPSTGLYSWSSNSNRTSIHVLSGLTPNVHVLPCHWPTGEWNDPMLFHRSWYSPHGNVSPQPQACQIPSKGEPCAHGTALLNQRGQSEKQLAAHWRSCPCLKLTKTPSWISIN